jgi:hypothetical protein
MEMLFPPNPNPATSSISRIFRIRSVPSSEGQTEQFECILAGFVSSSSGSFQRRKLKLIRPGHSFVGSDRHRPGAMIAPLALAQRQDDVQSHWLDNSTGAKRPIDHCRRIKRYTRRSKRAGL